MAVWRGRQVVRAYRRHINYPDTALQQAERQWFVGMVRFAAAARQALLLGLNETAARWQMTEGNAFVKLNKRHFGRAIGSASEDDVDYERLVLSCGAAAAVGVEGAAVGADGLPWSGAAAECGCCCPRGGTGVIPGCGASRSMPKAAPRSRAMCQLRSRKK